MWRISTARDVIPSHLSYLEMSKSVVSASAASPVNPIPLPSKAAAGGLRFASCYMPDDNTAEYLRNDFLEGGQGGGDACSAFYLMTRL